MRLPCPLKRGAPDRSESDRSWQAGHQAARRGRAAGHPARTAGYGGQCQRLYRLRGADRCHPRIRRNRRPRGAPRKRPGKLHADKAYDYDTRGCRQALARRGIRCRIARKGIESSEKLGRHRWVVERTLAWLNQFRRLAIHYERRADIHEAFLHLGCALIALRFLTPLLTRQELATSILVYAEVVEFLLPSN